MKQKIKNQLYIEVPAKCELMKAKNIEFYVKQGSNEKTYEPTVVSDTEMIVEIPYEDAMALNYGGVKLQFAYTDMYDNDHASEVLKTSVGEFLKEAGYSND